ncbi:hypothetical protein RRG08_048513 [Elysia crispata]|uniref:Uncharacterized protein n=1 Tax=Elysia crispata TaxID=231223 RepID=A0AAE1B5B4_9GAST|nr:hypothetical protein RRG08_048513 [Elysia crispata]
MSNHELQQTSAISGTDVRREVLLVPVASEQLLRHKQSAIVRPEASRWPGTSLCELLPFPPSTGYKSVRVTALSSSTGYKCASYCPFRQHNPHGFILTWENSMKCVTFDGGNIKTNLHLYGDIVSIGILSAWTY